MATAPAMLTNEDLQKMPDDGRRYELLGGEIIVSPSPSRVHQRIAVRLTVLLQQGIAPRDLGEVLPAPFDVRLSPHDIVQPDLLFVSRERLHLLRDSYADGAPDLVVEILSPSTRARDEGEKLALYAASGVREYWLVDPENKTFRALALEADRYRLLAPVDAIVESAVLPGLKIDTAALFADLP